VFVPAAGTIVMTAYLTNTVGNDLQIRFGGVQFYINTAAQLGFIGATMCDGVNVEYRNITGGGANLTLYGVSLA
ncbi:unnamed protein product, partial [marine sediment metagenome]